MFAGRMGALASTYVLENIGTQNHHFTPAEFVARYRRHFDDDGALDRPQHLGTRPSRIID